MAQTVNFCAKKGQPIKESRPPRKGAAGRLAEKSAAPNRPSPLRACAAPGAFTPDETSPMHSCDVIAGAICAFAASALMAWGAMHQSVAACFFGLVCLTACGGFAWEALDRRRSRRRAGRILQDKINTKEFI
ncbi:MAG: hypothetical protein QM586_13450 [Xenophilus sp.]